MLENKLIGAVERRLQERNLPIRVRFWNGKEVSGSQHARVALHLRSPSEIELLAKPSLGKLAEHYVKQKIDIDGDVHDCITLLAELFGNEPPPEIKPRPRFAPRLWARRRHTRDADRESIAFHYDVSNEFYALWLDARRVYSCAYFHSEDDTLDRAQEQKLDHICRKLDLKRDEQFLDIGCGWGALLLWAVEHYGARGTGITLSQNQLDHVQQIIRERGLEDRCSVRLLDYRDLAGETFDKIASVGMFEHVGIANLPVYFGKIHELLRPGGLVLNHGITSTRLDGAGGFSGGSEFIERYVFPDGELTHVSTVIQEMARQGLEVRDTESLRPHYAKTLWHWVRRLEARADAARALVGETRYRVWRTYMAGSAYAFESNFNSIYQILAGRPQADGSLPLPLTREYMYPR